MEDEAKGKNMERLEVEADNTKDKIEEQIVMRECIETNAMLRFKEEPGSKVLKVGEVSVDVYSTMARYQQIYFF